MPSKIVKDICWELLCKHQEGFSTNAVIEVMTGVLGEPTLEEYRNTVNKLKTIGFIKDIWEESTRYPRWVKK